MSDLVATTGCFDCFHAGHLFFLYKCSQYSSSGKVLVFLDSDDRVSSLKGVPRPFFSVIDRREMLLRSGVVDQVVVFESDSKLNNLIDSIRPDVFCKGKDWEGKKIIGEQYMKKIVFIENPIPISTSTIEDAICSAYWG